MLDDVVNVADPVATGILGQLVRLPRVILKALVRLYQLTLSPFIGGQCRFHPTCSEYAMDALEHHGALRGSILAARRLLRCQPFCDGGIDPVPPPRQRASAANQTTTANR